MNNKNNEFAALTGSVRSAKTIILSHDLDSYALLPVSVRRDLSVTHVRTWFIDVKAFFDGHTSEFATADGGDPGSKRVEAGLCFGGMLGAETDGRFGSAASVITSQFLQDYEVGKSSLTIIQLIPEITSYRLTCAFLAEMYGKTEFAALPDSRSKVTARLQTLANSPDQAIAECLAEHMTKEMFGILIALGHIRNNPVVQDHVVRQSFVELNIMLEFLKEARVSYNMLKCETGMIPFRKLGA